MNAKIVGKLVTKVIRGINADVPSVVRPVSTTGMAVSARNVEMSATKVILGRDVNALDVTRKEMLTIHGTGVHVPSVGRYVTKVMIGPRTVNNVLAAVASSRMHINGMVVSASYADM